MRLLFQQRQGGSSSTMAREQRPTTGGGAGGGAQAGMPGTWGVRGAAGRALLLGAVLLLAAAGLCQGVHSPTSHLATEPASI